MESTSSPVMKDSPVLVMKKGKTPSSKSTRERAQPYNKSKKQAVEKLKKSIYLPELPIKEPPKLVLDIPPPEVKPIIPEPKLIPDIRVTELKPVSSPNTPHDMSQGIEPGEIVEEQDSGDTENQEGNLSYTDFLSQVLDQAPLTYPCPIHHTPLQELKAKDPTSQNMYLQCESTNCPVFTNLEEYGDYYYGCREQGHRWYTLERIQKMKCECGDTPSLAMSKSEKNFHKMYLRCRDNTCGLFTFWKYHPIKKTIQTLTQS